MTKVLNLFGAPGAGKSTAAAYLFSQFKMLGYDCEYVTEYAKDKVYEQAVEVFKNQAYMFGKQYFRMTRLIGKVDLIITDSPLLLSKLYNHSEVLGEKFNELVVHVASQQDSMNYLLKRVHRFQKSGRIHNEEAANIIENGLEQFLTINDVDFDVLDGDISSYSIILDSVKAWLDNGSLKNTSEKT